MFLSREIDIKLCQIYTKIHIYTILYKNSRIKQITGQCWIIVQNTDTATDNFFDKNAQILPCTISEVLFDSSEFSIQIRF